MSAVLAAFFGYFFTGSIRLVTEGKLPKWGKITIQAGGGAALFVLVLLWWGSDFAPVKKLEKEVRDIGKQVKVVGKGMKELEGFEGRASRACPQISNWERIRMVKQGKSAVVSQTSTIRLEMTRQWDCFSEFAEGMGRYIPVANKVRMG